MALMIPENVPTTASEIERETYEQLRSAFPSHCVIWHSEALELNEAQRVPFLAIAEQIGIRMAAPPIKKFAKEIAAIERELCAQICDDIEENKPKVAFPKSFPKGFATPPAGWTGK